MTTTKPEQQPCGECKMMRVHWTSCSFNTVKGGPGSPVLPSERITQPVGERRCDTFLNGKVRCVLASYHTGVGSEHEYDPAEVRAAFPKWSEAHVQFISNGPAQSSVTAAASEKMIYCADCGTGRAASTLADPATTFVCRHCLSTTPAPRLIPCPACEGCGQIEEVAPAAASGGEGERVDGHRIDCRAVASIGSAGFRKFYVRYDNPEMCTCDYAVPAPAPEPVEGEVPKRLTMVHETGIGIDRYVAEGVEGLWLLRGTKEVVSQIVEAYNLFVTCSDLHQPSRLTDAEKAEVDAIEVRLNAASSGPWSWDVNMKAHQVTLESDGKHHIVMDFARWGMGNAAPRFYLNGLMERVDKLVAVVTGREHHAHWFQTVKHPDAELIANAPTDIRRLLQLLVRKGEA